MTCFLFLIFALYAADICMGQYPPSYNNAQRQVYPNQVYQVRRRPGIVRPKPHYSRVHPSEYRRIMEQGTQEQVLVSYPKQQPVRQVYYPVYPKKYHYQRPVQQQTYNPYYQKARQYNPYARPYQQKVVSVYRPNTNTNTYKPKWPKLRGRCQSVPDFKINGVNPIKEECSKGRAILLFLMKRRCDFCYHQLKQLNVLAEHYKKTGKPLTVIAINHKRGRLSPATRRQYPHVKIVEEPADQDLFGKLGGAWRQIIIYDVCCRKQYLYGYPFSWMGYSFVRHAIFNTLYYDQVICGVCKAATQAPNTTVTTAPVETRPPTF